MQKSIETIRQLRHTVLKTINGLSLEQLNRIPEGFNNNIIWNAAHLVAAQQGICYRRSKQPLQVSDAFFEAYKPDSKPGAPVTQQEVEEIKGLLLSTVDALQEDYDKGLFNGAYEAFVSRYGVPLNTLEEAVAFLPFHEGFHLGYITALKRIIGQS